MESMKFSVLAALIPLFVTISSAAQAALEPQDDAKNYVLCKNAKTVRTLRVEQTDDDKNCVAFYTKAGVDREVARAQIFSKCMQVVDNIKGNLEKANWKCKEVKSASFTSSENE